MIENKQKILTVKQKRVYDFIRDFLHKNSFSPTVTEIKDYLAVSSLRTVTQYLESLENKGFISRVRSQSRGIRLISSDNSDFSTVTLPVLSSAGCDNMDVFAQPTFDEFITLDKEFLKGKNPDTVVAFRAVGDSMVDAGIETGDLVLAEKTSNINQKDKVVAVVDGMALIKQISFTPNAVILSPMTTDTHYRPIVMRRDFQVFGKVIEIIKNSFEHDELTYEFV